MSMRLQPAASSVDILHLHVFDLHVSYMSSRLLTHGGTPGSPHAEVRMLTTSCNVLGC